MKILVVDDEKLLVKGIRFNLENEGFQVETAYDGATAVELARTGNFDLIILDLMMPVLSGTEAYTALQAAMDLSNELMEKEYYSMRLVAESRGWAEETLPAALRAVTITPEMAAQIAQGRIAQIMQDLQNMQYMQ